MSRPGRAAGPAPREASDAEIRAYRRGHGPHAAIRVGLLSNPMARTNWRSVAHERLVPLLPDPLAAVSTTSVDEIPRALDHVLFQRRCNVLAINGGDGTIHHVVNRALAVCDAASARLGEPVPLPLFLFLNGGGMNMLARAFDTRGHPRRTLLLFLARARRRAFGELPRQRVPLLSVTEPDGTVRHGFIFGSGLVLNALTMYERFGQGYAGLARFLAEVYAGHYLQTELWHRHRALLDPPATPVTVDGTTWTRWLALVASTVPMTLARGLVVTLPRAAAPGTLEGLLVVETRHARLMRLIPRLMRARPAEGVIRLARARRVDLRGPYTLDGERLTRLPADAALALRGTDRAIEGIWLGAPRAWRRHVAR